MNHSKLSSLCRRAAVMGLAASTFLPSVGQVMAAPGDLSQIPLYVGPNVEPNVVFLNDDSGSMEFSVMTPEDGGNLWLNGEEYLYTHPLRVSGGGNSAWRGQSYSYTGSGTLQIFSGQARVVPTQEALDYCFSNSLSTEERGAWRAWNHNYNALYYNPEITYRPWVGVNINGAAYGDANPSAALVNPYNPAGGSENLTANREYTTRYPRGSNKTHCASAHSDWTIRVNSSNYPAFFPARYYAWTDSNGNGEVDPLDDNTLIEIKPGTTYDGGPGRTDCAAAPVCSYEEEIQNFANWFSYHRNRDYTAKNAATTAISEVTGIRVGYATINSNTSARYRVASMNADASAGNKRNLFNRIFNAMPGAGVGTPLRTALHETGLYYECKSGNIMGASGSNCPILPASQGGMCQKNYTILMTDGFWNDTSNPGISPGNADGNNNTAWDGPPYGDNYSFTLADVAMHYYERDLSSSLANEVPSTTGAKDNAPHQHMTTFTVAFGVSGSLDPEKDDPTAAGFSWPNPNVSGDAPEKIDDLWHAAYNGRGEFYNAQNPETLESGLKAAFASVARGKSSSASVAFNTTKLGTDSMVYQASFNPSDNWSGALVATELTLDGQLGGEAWNAATILNQAVPSSRTILTFNESTGTGIPFRTMSDLSQRQQNDLDTGPSGSLDNLGQERLDYLRGDRSNEGPGQGLEFRERSHVLGDIVYSNPVYVGRPELGYEDDPSFGDGEYSSFSHGNISRTPVVYVGANDGMLHGFNAGTGEEVLAYVPNKLFSSQQHQGLHYLTDPAYEHRYYVDLSPTVSDVYTGGAWRTILIGGFRAGERGLFALDVTNPATFSEANADDIVLWEFTSDDHNGLGHSFSKPTIALLENDKWAAIFGNGYNDLGDGQAKLYILFLESGMDGSWSAGDYLVISTQSGNTTNRNGLSTPVLVDSNNNGKADRVYAGDLMGNLWAFDISQDNEGNWGVAYKQGSSPRALFNATAGSAQPITAKPVVARNPMMDTNNQNRPNILVMFGTGQYLVNGDKNSTGTQSFYGIWDRLKGTSPTYTRADLVQQSVDFANSTADLRTTTDHVVNYDSEAGWYIDLPEVGERVVVDPKIRGEYVFFNTLIPDPNTCNTKGLGWLMALKYANGGNPDKPVYDVNNDGEINEGDMIDGTNVPSGVRLDGIPAGSNFLDDMMYTPDDEGNIDIRRIDAGISFESGRLSWREVRQ